jgi:hypothetical protein
MPDQPPDRGVFQAEPPPEAVDDTAQKEAIAIAESRLAKYQRDESMRVQFHRAGLVLFWGAFVTFLLLSAVWLWHIIAPASWRFLTPTEVVNLQSILVTALGSTVIAQVGKRWIKNLDEL